MPKSYHYFDKPEGTRTLGRWVLIWTYLAALVGAAVVFAVLYSYNSQLSSELSAFQSALEGNNYVDALNQYREIQGKVLDQDPGATEEQDSRERQIMLSMEDIILKRVEGLEEQIRKEHYKPRADDRAFLEQMNELTGAYLSGWLQSLSTEFLLGQIDKDTLRFIFDEIGAYPNVKATADPIKAELDMIEKASPKVQEAEQAFQDKSYIEAVKIYQEVISDEEFQGLVKQFSVQRLDECKTVMYDPMLEYCDNLISNYRYYTAENILTDLALIFPNDTKIQDKLIAATSNTVPVEEFKGRVEVICIKPLIADPEQAFSVDNRKTVAPYRLTAGEFSRILEQLYANDYMLIDVHFMAGLTNPQEITQNHMMLPKGKKPLIIIVEDVNYSGLMLRKGLNNRLLLNEQNQVVSESFDKAEESVISRDREAVGILDAFVETHPDFSFDGAKGIISFSGYETVMGYVTSDDQLNEHNKALNAMGLASPGISAQAMQQNQETVKRIMNRLKETGWSIASSTYGFVNAKDLSQGEIEADTQKWLDQVGNMAGFSDILVYPNGSFINGKDPRSVYLKNQGFRIFFGIGSTAYYAFGENYLYLDRAIINGDTLGNADYQRFFDGAVVRDPARP